MGSSDLWTSLRRVQFRVRPEYTLATVSRGIDALCVLRGLQTTTRDRVDFLALVMIELPLQEPVDELMACVRKVHPAVPILLVSERRDEMAWCLPGADGFWSHGVESVIALFAKVAVMSRVKRGPKHKPLVMPEKFLVRALTLEDVLERRAA